MNENLLNKIVKKNYNNQLEQVLTQKDFSIDVKNTLLTMLYKIENGYNDYETIKRPTYDKQEYIEKLISIIKNDCEKIKFINPKDEQREEINKDQKEIICYPIETHILYNLAKIQKKNIVTEYLDETMNEAMSTLLNIGNNINLVEPLRDFNRIFMEYNSKRHTRFKLQLIIPKYYILSRN